MIKTSQLKGVLFFFFLIVGYIVLQDSCHNSTSVESEFQDTLTITYVGSANCKSCHQDEFTDWQMSDHHQAMAVANDSTVVGDFNKVTFTADGVTNSFFKKDNKFYINSQGEDGKNHDYQVLYTFGIFPLQQYLIELPGGRMQSSRVSWDVRNKKWFHQYAGQKINSSDWMHWTGNSQNWNTMCASCHSTNLVKNYDYKTDSYHTTFSEINVSCESCHGPGSKHLNFINSNAYKSGVKLTNSGFYYAKDSNAQMQLNTCAPCHARKTEIAADFVHNGQLLDNIIPQNINDEFYFADGQIKQEDYEYGSFTQSKMFHNNVRCSNCHNPHSGKLKLQGNNLCLSCHQPKYDSKEHYFHEPNSEGSKCVNCHMPTKTFMGVDIRRDHSLRIPRPDQSLVYNTPNACTNCHTNQNNKWAADAIKKHFGDKRAYHFSDDLLPGSLRNETSETHLINLLSDSSQPAIARATAATYLGEIVTVTSANALLQNLNSSDALIRYYALRALNNFPPTVWQTVAYTSLSDKVRAVRIAAAGLYHLLPPNQIPKDYEAAYLAADNENKNFLHYQTDFSVGNLLIADYELQSGDYVSAVNHYLRGLKKDSLMNYGRLNLAATYNSIGQNDEALKVLKQAEAIDKQNDRIYYNMGLLYFEMDDNKMAATAFEKAVFLKSTIPDVYYNYGLILLQEKNLKKSETVLLKGYAIDPNSLKLNYALAYFYLQQNNASNALKYAKTLYTLDPGNPEYQHIYHKLGLTS